MTSLRNLEVLEPLHRDAPRQSCLYGALNRTATPMGARRLRDWLSQPLANQAGILRRQDAIQRLVQNGPALESLQHELGEVRDLERVLGRLGFGSGNARDLTALKTALLRIPVIKAVLLALQNDSSATRAVAGGVFPRSRPDSFARCLAGNPRAGR